MNLPGILFPDKCPVCGTIHQKGGRGICKTCREKLLFVTEPCCKRCGKPVASSETEYCEDCSRRESSLEQGVAVWVYNDEMKKAMADFKYGGCTADGVFYAEELLFHKGSRLSDWHIDGIIPVPIHFRKKWFRGYNQSACVAEAAGERLCIPVYPEGLIRIRYTKPQKGLDDRQRAENLRGAIQVNKKYSGVISRFRGVLLVDDIYTTGATLEECGRVLRKCGVQKVYFACLCIGSDY